MTRRSRAVRFLALVAGATNLIAQQPASPGTRLGASMVYDAARRQTLLFGGVATDAAGQNTLPGDLWAWDGHTWRKLSPADGVAPPGRAHASFAYDAARQRAVLVGGRSESGNAVAIQRGAWEWDGTRWHKPVDSLGLLHATLAYDAARRRVVMFGGLNDAGLSRKLMEWSGRAWLVRDTVGPPNGANPPMAAASAVTPSGDVIVVIEQSGRSSDSVAMRTWTWSGGAWKRGELGPAMTNLQPTATAPDGTIYIYHTPGEWLKTPLLHVRTPGGAWTSRALPNQPVPRGFPAAAYDADRRRFILHGAFGSGGLTETWEFDGTAWTKPTPARGTL